MENKIKYVINGIIGAAAIFAIISFAVVIMKYEKQVNNYKQMDARLLELSEQSIEVCNQAIKDWGQADEQTLDFVNDYVENINAARTPRQKSYIAQSMVAYVAKLVTYSNYYLKNDVEKGNITHPVQTYQWIVNKLDDMTLQLTSARNFDYYTNGASKNDSTAE